MSEEKEEKRESIKEKAKKIEEETSKLFDPDELIKDAKKVRYIDDPELGRVKYRLPTMEEMLSLSKTQNDEERALKLVQIMMDVYPGLTIEKLKALPATSAVRLLNLLLEKAGFRSG